MRVRSAVPADARAVAAVHVAGWRSAYPASFPTTTSPACRSRSAPRRGAVGSQSPAPTAACSSWRTTARSSGSATTGRVVTTTGKASVRSRRSTSRPIGGGGTGHAADRRGRRRHDRGRLRPGHAVVVDRNDRAPARSTKRGRGRTTTRRRSSTWARSSCASPLRPPPRLHRPRRREAGLGLRVRARRRLHRRRVCALAHHVFAQCRPRVLRSSSMVDPARQAALHHVARAAAARRPLQPRHLSDGVRGPTRAGRPRAGRDPIGRARIHGRAALVHRAPPRTSLPPDGDPRDLRRRDLSRGCGT